MSRKTRNVAALVAGFGAISLGVSGAVLASGPAETADLNVGKTLFSERCSTCHALETVTARHAPSKEWHEIVERMIMNGAQLTDTETDAIVAYLAASQGPKN